MTESVLIIYVLPIVGCLLVLALASSPIKAMQICERKGELGSFNPFPPALFLATNIVWVINGLLIEDVFVFFINVVMVFVNGHITLRCYRMAEPLRAGQLEQILFIFSLVAMLSGFGFLYADLEKVAVAYGWMCATFNMFVFIPPMLLMQEVVREKNSVTINAPFAFVGAVTTAFWCAYGLLIPIYALTIPNGFGCVLSIVQIFLTLLYPGHDPKEDTGETLVTKDKEPISDTTDLESHKHPGDSLGILMVEQ
jgi:solute carrier family 50 protein (sugar transporter)